MFITILYPTLPGMAALTDEMMEDSGDYNEVTYNYELDKKEIEEEADLQVNILTSARRILRHSRGEY